MFIIQIGGTLEKKKKIIEFTGYSRLKLVCMREPFLLLFRKLTSVIWYLFSFTYSLWKYRSCSKKNMPFCAFSYSDAQVLMRELKKITPPQDLKNCSWNGKNVWTGPVSLPAPILQTVLNLHKLFGLENIP